MLETVMGYYDGDKIIVDDWDRQKLSRGQELVITYFIPQQASDGDRADRRLAFLQSRECVRPSKRNAEEIDTAIRELRDHDRF